MGSKPRDEASPWNAVATANGLRWALCAMMVVNVWSALHYMLAARTLRKDLAG